jgi:hypothetical protein
MTMAELAQRLDTLEKTVAEIQAQIAALLGTKRHWWVKGAGRFKGDPVFAEIVELGREYRESLRPGRGRNKRNRA